MSSKQEILENEFGVVLLQYDVDEAFFAELCDSLAAFSAANAASPEVDKEVAHFVFELQAIMRYKLDPRDEGVDPADRQLLARMLDDLERIVLGKLLARPG